MPTNYILNSRISHYREGHLSLPFNGSISHIDHYTFTIHYDDNIVRKYNKTDTNSYLWLYTYYKESGWVNLVH